MLAHADSPISILHCFPWINHLGQDLSGCLVFLSLSLGLGKLLLKQLELELEVLPLVVLLLLLMLWCFYLLLCTATLWADFEKMDSYTLRLQYHDRLAEAWEEATWVVCHLQCWCSSTGGKPWESLGRGQEEGLASQQSSSFCGQSTHRPNLQTACRWECSRRWQSINEAPSRYHARLGGTSELSGPCLQTQGCAWWTCLCSVGMRGTWCHRSWRTTSSLCRGLQDREEFREFRGFEWVTVTYLSKSIWSGCLRCTDKPCNLRWETGRSPSWTWTWRRTGQWWCCCWVVPCDGSWSFHFCLKLQLHLTAFEFLNLKFPAFSRILIAYYRDCCSYWTDFLW